MLSASDLGQSRVSFRRVKGKFYPLLFNVSRLDSREKFLLLSQGQPWIRSSEIWEQREVKGEGCFSA